MGHFGEELHNWTKPDRKQSSVKMDKSREKRIKSLVKKIQKSVDDLKKENCVISDRYSTICVFDTTDLSEGEEGKAIATIK